MQTQVQFQKPLFERNRAPQPLFSNNFNNSGLTPISPFTFDRYFPNFGVHQAAVGCNEFKVGKRQSCDSIDVFLESEEELFSTVTHSDTHSVQSDEFFLVNQEKKKRQKRTKWTKQECSSLWKGIEKFGNNWRGIKEESFPDRTYYQVKDKGRRILSAHGWSSGRSKVSHSGAGDLAKEIAEKVLLEVNTSQSLEI
eukprot:snap_masked-scaffold_26-processed-gene-0.38-mRNA-1 protein AED:0.12 eAED:0.14 QI:0/-1/0/1/-1/1/1/0/195